MSQSELTTLSNNKLGNATKWSFYAEVSAKIIVPVTNMILARILVPEAFGIIATINMVISFTDMFTTAGFQKYLIQHEYHSKEELYKGTSVAFWTNLGLSFLLWAIICVFNAPIASFVGNDGQGFAIVIACISLPLTSFTSIQQALYQRDLNFKILFYNRLLSSLLPFVVTIPLALIGLGYWALIIGTICGNLVKAVVLTIKSQWKPNIFYDLTLLKEMLSFSIWTLFESLALWASTWVDILIIGNFLGSYYTGLYKHSQSTVTSILTIVSAATTTVLFSSLSRVQNDQGKFDDIYYKMQKNVSMFLLPMGIGIFVFSDFITIVLLGNQWAEASSFIGIWGLCTSLVATYGTFCREAYRAKGRPKLSLVAQLLHLVFVIPVCYLGIKQGFNVLIYIRSLAFLQIILVHFIFVRIFLKMSPLLMLKNTNAPMLCAVIMGGVGYFLKHISTNYFMDALFICVCVIFYFSCLCMVPSYRNTLVPYIKTKVLRMQI